MACHHTYSITSTDVESVLTCCIAVWFGNSTAHDRKALQRVIKLAQKNHRGRSPSLQDTYKWASNIISNPIHSTQNLFTLVKSGKWYWSTAARTFRLRNRLYPQAIRLIKQWSLASSFHLHFFLRDFICCIPHIALD